MADALGKLFGSFDNVKDDVVEYGITGAAAVGANAGFNFAWGKAVEMVGTRFAVPAWAKPVAALVLAGVAGRYAGKFDKRVGTGVAVGLALSAVQGLITNYAPAELRATLGLGGYGGRGLGYGAPTTVEAMNGAPTSIEAVNGLSEVAVGPGSFQPGFGRSNLAATFS